MRTVGKYRSQDYRGDLDTILNFGWYVGAIIFLGGSVLGWIGIVETDLTHTAAGVACLAMATKAPKR